mmetsp:Transcript_14845/g.36346  ORF Transcript_14845/g.36346 Transcript_14845/m.36346 type:complete len:1559 (+) Transcript_14845:478-5154(+)
MKERSYSQQSDPESDGSSYVTTTTSSSENSGTTSHSSISSSRKTCSRRTFLRYSLLLFAVILMSFIIVTIIWIVDLKNFQRHARPSFSVSSLNIDGRNPGPEANFQVGLKYSSSSSSSSGEEGEREVEVEDVFSLKYSSIDIQSVICQIPSGQIDLDFESIPKPSSTSKDEQRQQQPEEDYYEVNISCPDEDIDDHATMLWELLVGKIDDPTTTPSDDEYYNDELKDDSSLDTSGIFEEGTCSLSIRVCVGRIIPIDYTYDLHLNDVMEFFSSNQAELQTDNESDLPIMNPLFGLVDDGQENRTDFNDVVDIDNEELENDIDIDHQNQDQDQHQNSYPSMEWIHLDRVNVDEMTVGLCATGLEQFMKSVGLQSALIHLPALTIHALPSHTHGMTIEMEELEVSLPREGWVAVGQPSNRVCAYFSIRSTHENVPFYRPVLDLVVSDEQPDTIKIDVDGSGSFVETMLGKTHSLIFTRDTDVTNDGMIPVRGRDRHLRDEVEAFQDAYNAAAAECLNIEDDTGAFGVGLCSIVDIPGKSVSLLGSVGLYDFGIAGVSNTNWVLNSTDEGDTNDRIDLETNALMVLKDETGIMNVTGGFILDVTDSEDSDQIAAVDVSLINDGSLWPFECILDVDFLEAGDVLTAAVNEVTFLFKDDGLDRMTGDITLDIDALIMKSNLADVTNQRRIHANAELEITDDLGFSLTVDSKCVWDRTDKWNMVMKMSNTIKGDIQAFSMNVDEIVSGFNADGLTTVDSELLQIESNTKFSTDNTNSDFVVRGSIDLEGDTDFMMSGSSSMTWDGDDIFDINASCLYDTPFDLVIIQGEVSESASDFLITTDIEYNKEVETLSATLTHGLFKDDVITVQGGIVDDPVADFEMNGQSSCIWNDEIVWGGNLSVSFYDYFESDDTASLEARLTEKETDFSMQTKIVIDDVPGEFALVLQNLVVDVKGKSEVDSHGVFRVNTDIKSVDLDLENEVGDGFIANMTFAWSPDFGRIETGRVTSFDGSNFYLQVEKAEVLASEEGLWDSSSLSLAILMPYTSGSLNGIARYAWDDGEEKFSCGMDNLVVVWEDETYLNLNTEAILDLDDTSFSFTVEETANLGTEGDIAISMQLDDPDNDDEIRMDKMFWRSASRTVIDSTGLLKIESTDDVVDISVFCDSDSTATLQMFMDCGMTWDGDEENFSTRMDRMVMGWDSKIFVEMPIEVLSFDNDVKPSLTPVDTQSPTSTADPNLTTSPQTLQPTTLDTSTPEPSTQNNVDTSTPTSGSSWTDTPQTQEPTATFDTPPPEPVGTDSIVLEIVDVFLAGVGNLSPREVASFQEITQGFLEIFHSSSSVGLRRLRPSEFSDFKTNVTVGDQRVDGTGNTVTTNLLFMFESEINITKSDSLHLVEAPFLDDVASQQYVDTLQNFGDEGLSAVTSVSVDTSNTVVTLDDDSENDDQGADDDSDEGGLTTGSLIGIVVGSAVAVIVCCISVVWYRKRHRSGTESNDDKPSYTPPTIEESKRLGSKTHSECSDAHVDSSSEDEDEDDDEESGRSYDEDEDEGDGDDDYTDDDETESS